MLGGGWDASGGRGGMGECRLSAAMEYDASGWLDRAAGSHPLHAPFICVEWREVAERLRHDVACGLLIHRRDSAIHMLINNERGLFQRSEIFGQPFRFFVNWLVHGFHLLRPGSSPQHSCPG